MITYIVCLHLFVLNNNGNGVMVMADEAPKVPQGEIMPGFSKEDEAKMSGNTESFEFQAEVSRLMDIIINSLCKFTSLLLQYYIIEIMHTICYYLCVMYVSFR